jgi:cation diffusion facilitator CzcD-associated flavoprotein CzcO
MANLSKTADVHDVIIVGAGISGINAGYRLQTELPGINYTILEQRDSLGGTWDLFKYPGIRSDSDLHTFGFKWRPWNHPKAIADGKLIKEYLQESAEVYGIDKKIQYHHELKAANWSSDQQAWQLEVVANGETKYFHTRFLLLGTGYYDYKQALETDIPGIENFQGTTIHPQFWPEDYDYTDKNIVIVGSGATAITLLPVLAEKAAHVTLLQRSPTYILTRPSVDPMGSFMHRWLPSWAASKLVRWKFLVLPFLFFKFCRRFPQAARGIIKSATEKELPPSVSHNPHFSPKYNPWEQRLCVCPDGDFYKALRGGKTSIVTDHIENVSEKTITTRDGTVLAPDTIITATGLKIQIAGGAQISVDRQPVRIGEKFLWKGLMLQDLPNLATVIGYTNASWTLGADATALAVCRLLKVMRSKGVSSATPRVPDESKLNVRPVLNLNSTYVERGKGEMPKAADKAPWLPRSTYFSDLWEAQHGNIEQGLQFSRAETT